MIVAENDEENGILIWRVIPHLSHILPILLFLLFWAGETSCWADEKSAFSGEDISFSTESGRKIISLLEEKNSKGWDCKLYVLDAKSGEKLLSFNGSEEGNPASLLKVITAGAALKYLGKGFTFKTEFLTDSPLNEEGSIGNLFIRGGGDPDLVFERCYAIARNLKALGIDRIRGSLIGDESFFDKRRKVEGWLERDPEKGERPYNSPISALSANYNTVSIIVNPLKADMPAIVRLETPGSFVRLRDEVKVIPSGGKGADRLRLDYSVEGGKGIYTVSGTIREGSSPQRFYRIVEDPPLYTCHILRSIFEEIGIVVEGGVEVGEVPENATLLLSYSSPPLPEILIGMNKFSNNFTAEMVLKVLGAELYGRPGTTEKGVRALIRFLDEAGVSLEGVKIVNGSGLSNKNSISPEKVVKVMKYILDNFGDMPELLSTLPVSGIDGTLRRILKGEELTGRIRAKTGFLRDACNIAGFAETHSGRVLLFALFINRFPSYYEGNELRKMVSSLLLEL